MAMVEWMESRLLLTTITVNTAVDTLVDPTSLSLRQAIEISNGTLPVSSLTPEQLSLVNVSNTAGNTIRFDIPAAVPSVPAQSDGSQSVPVPGFDPNTQTWRIALTSPLPPITHQVTIDGYTQGQTPIPFRYPNQLETQVLSITGNPTGGTFTLSTTGIPQLLPNGKTVALPVNASASDVQSALESIVKTATDDVVAFGGPLPANPITIAFTGINYANFPFSNPTSNPPSNPQPIPPLMIPDNSLTGGVLPMVTAMVVPPTTTDAIITTPNTMAAIDGNNAIQRVIIDGSGITTSGPNTGFALDASHSIIRGLIITGFSVGVSVPDPNDVGDLIQGNDIGKYPLSFVDPNTGQTLIGLDLKPIDPATNIPLTFVSGSIGITGQGNSLQGVLLGSTNTTVGGVETQDNNVIIGNGQQGVSILPGAQGNQILGNQIGIYGPTSTGGVYFIVPNGAEGVLIADSSNYVGEAATGAGNLISGNAGDGVHIVSPAATRNNVIGNFIGTSPGGGFLFGSSDPGNLGDGVLIDNASDNNIGGTTTGDRNVISSNGGAGVRILDASGVRNLVQGNYIGLTSDGISALGNGQAGVAIFSADNTIGSGNVISSNLRGVLLSGAGATGNLVNGNLIGTDSTGTADLGNAQEGVRIDDGASNNIIMGNAQGSQVISGNNVGIFIFGVMSKFNQVQGNLIGTDIKGTLDLGNSQAGVELDDAPANLVGGSTATVRNLISANYWGVEITGPASVANVVQGNFIGTEITGQTTLGNELDGVYINQGAFANLIGGTTAAAGNTIAFNRENGVRIEDASVSNAILSNSIFANLESGINLVPSAASPNPIVNPPILTAVASSINSTIISGILAGTPNSTFTIQFFFSSPLDPTGLGEGGQYVGQTTATTGADGVASYSANVPAVLKSGQFVTATATDSSGNTSEFSVPLTEVYGTVQFQMASYIVTEGVGTATIEATRSGGSGGYFTVNYATADGTGVAGSAYQAAMGTLTFQPGQTTQTFSVTILDNGQPEGDVSVFLALSNPAGPISLGTQSTAVLTILGNQPGAFQFQMSSYAVDQAAGTATIAVTRSQGGLGSTVNYSTADGTAVAGTDYVATSGTLTFAPGVLTQTFTIPILLNPNLKANETVLLNLSSPSSNASLGSPSSAVLVIIDDGINREGPSVTSVKAVSGPVGVAEVVVSFNEPINPASAVNLLNYGYSVRTAGRDGKLGTKDDRLVGISSATYNPATMTVTLPLGFAVPNQTKLLFQINEATDVPGAGVGVSDLSGNLLDGTDDGHPGSPFSAVVVAQPAPKVVTKSVAKSNSHKAKPAKVTPIKSQPKHTSTPKAKPSAHHR